MSDHVCTVCGRRSGLAAKFSALGDQFGVCEACEVDARGDELQSTWSAGYADGLSDGTKSYPGNAYDLGAAVAFGLMGMAEAIRARPIATRDRVLCHRSFCYLDAMHKGPCESRTMATYGGVPLPTERVTLHRQRAEDLAMREVCGHCNEGDVMVACDCGKVRPIYRPHGCPCLYLPAIDVEGHRHMRAVALNECPIHGAK